jgi:hypothetical protein
MASGRKPLAFSLTQMKQETLQILIRWRSTYRDVARRVRIVLWQRRHLEPEAIGTLDGHNRGTLILPSSNAQTPRE